MQETDDFVADRFGAKEEFGFDSVAGNEFRVTAEGFLARIFQHEIDHTNGKVFIDHIQDKPEAFFKLDTDGHLIKLDYEKEIHENSLLW